MNNRQRLIELADSTFSPENDPHQLDVTFDLVNQMVEIDSACFTEAKNPQTLEPVGWFVIIPSDSLHAAKFIAGQIGEKELLENFMRNRQINSVYLCSGIVLPEFRKQKIAQTTFVDSIKRVKQFDSIQSIFAWPFSPEGQALSKKIAESLELPLQIRDRSKSS